MNPRRLVPSRLGLLVVLATAASCQLPQPRITRPPSDGDPVTLPGNIHPIAAAAIDSLAAEPAAPMQHLVLHLLASDQQEAELDALLAEQADPGAPGYRAFVTPEEFAARFGVAPQDVAVVSAWLERHGLTIEALPVGGRTIVFGGTVAQVEGAFQTEVRQYTHRGARFVANASEPRIPAAFAGVVGGVVKLHDFQHEAHFVMPSEGVPVPPRGSPAPSFAPAGARMLTPGDLATIYDTNPLLASGVDGAGSAIAVIARSNIYLSDVVGFRTLFGLKANDPQIIVTNGDPGQRSGDNVETTLDTEWAGAVAPGAKIKVIVSSSASGSDGIDLSAIHAVSNNVAPIITVSYGTCEGAMGATQQAFYHSLWKQAAAQGQTVLVASGDSGAAGCDLASAKAATHGKGVNGLCSSPYATCVGGTQLSEGANPGKYWFPASPGATGGSAMGYIPEAAWNESASVTGGGGLWAGGGGASAVYAKPAWQTGKGVPADGKRDVPDLSLTAAAHDGYTVVQGGQLGYIFAVGGTSASTPAFAGMMALVGQKTQSAQGSINQTLYALATRQASGGAAVFHDVTTGNNSVPGVAGYAAAAGYDLATGLGSVDANLLATVWNGALGKAALTVYASAVTMNRGQSASTTVTTAASGLNAAVALSVLGAPAGVTATLAAASVAKPGSGAVSLKIAAAANVTPGVYTLTVSASGGGQTATCTIDVTVTQPTFTLAYSGGLYPMINLGPTVPFAPQKVSFQTQPANGFNSTITFSATGMPAGMAVAFSPASVPGAAVGNTVATVSAVGTVKGGSYKFTVNASGGGVTQSVTYLAIVNVQPSCQLTASTLSLAFKAGAGATVALTCPAAKPSATPITLSVTGVPGGGGLPGGVTAKLAPATTTPGGSSTLTLSTTGAVTPGTYPITVIASEASGATQMVQIYAAISTPVFTLSLSPASVTGTIGKTVQFTAVVTPEPGFNSPVTVWIGSRPTGVSASFGPTSIANPSCVLTLTIDRTAVAGTYPLTIGAIANTGFSRTVVSTLTLKK